MSNKISIVCVSGTREKLQMAAMFASVAAATGGQVSVFLSMNALPHFVKGHVANAPSEGEFGDLLRQQGVPPFKQLFQQAAELGDASLLPCSMALDLMKVTKDDLDPELGPPTGLTRFLGDAEGGQLLTF
ncbi:MAG: DsrE/DsrF/DrsH-like family protein [Gammaproteobacteria bacterium]|nr:DsrE/DsrF/DrsH-like family protein [Gammaproteobacteria bacterium]